MNDATQRPVLGIDIGGSGIKGAPVDLGTGELADERVRIDTPEKSTPDNIAEVVKQIVEEFRDQLADDGPVGITVPAAVINGVTKTAANIDKSWIGAPARDIFAKALGRDVLLVNDADAAGIAEAQYGAGRANPGLVLMTTLGTGIGTALIYKGILVPNTELGHIEIDGTDAETVTSEGARERGELSFSEWVPLLQRYYSALEAYFWPDLFVVGGGVSKKSHKFLPQLKLNTPIVPAKLRNQAGIIGAAYLASNPDQQRGGMRSAQS